MEKLEYPIAVLIDQLDEEEDMIKGVQSKGYIERYGKQASVEMANMIKDRIEEIKVAIEYLRKRNWVG